VFGQRYDQRPREKHARYVGNLSGLRILIIVTCTVCFFFTLRTTEAASTTGDRSYGSLFDQLGDTTHIVLMVVRKLVPIEPSATDKTLPRVACMYRIPRSGPESSYAKLIEIMKQDIVAVKENSRLLARAPSIVVRMGMIFKDGDRDLRSFYFEDWAGAHGIEGLSGEYQFWGSADTPEHIRSLLPNKDVFFERGSPTCPHS
jgi:hypothetical protein